MPQVPILLQPKPEVGGHAGDARQPQARIGRYSTLAADNLPLYCPRWSMNISNPGSPGSSYMHEAIRLAIEGVQKGCGGPFGAVVVKGDQIVGSGWNCVTSLNDPTAHAEVLAIRDACKTLRVFHLTGCELYASCEPCPMCLSAIYWARIERYYFGCTAHDAASIQFADDFIRHELSVSPSERTIPAVALMRAEALAAFTAWQAKPDRVAY
jgi:guanine deaminase